jgi:NAD(P)-dependent dehydrogenase (short-subunit alcohol dehydrogenase family)
MSARVLVTGAADGIGAATITRLRARGARVAGVDLRADGDGVIACDVRDQSAVDAAVAAAAERLGGIDVLVNNAGVGHPQKATLPPDEDARAVLDVNLLGPWRVTAAAMEHLRAARGRVVNVASGLAHLSVPLAPAYCASKRGLVAYSDALRLEAGHEVTVTTVYPGYVRTRIHDASQRLGFGLEGLVPAEPLDRVADRVVRACLGRPVRDLATTRAGTVNYALLRIAPRGLTDRITLAAIRRRARTGELDGSPLAGDLARALARRGDSPRAGIVRRGGQSPREDGG